MAGWFKKKKIESPFSIDFQIFFGKWSDAATLVLIKWVLEVPSVAEKTNPSDAFFLYSVMLAKSYIFHVQLNVT